MNRPALLAAGLFISLVPAARAADPLVGLLGLSIKLGDTPPRMDAAVVLLFETSRSLEDLSKKPPEGGDAAVWSMEAERTYRLGMLREAEIKLHRIIKSIEHREKEFTAADLAELMKGVQALQKGYADLRKSGGTGDESDSKAAVASDSSASKPPPLPKTQPKRIDGPSVLADLKARREVHFWSLNEDFGVLLLRLKKLEGGGARKLDSSTLATLDGSSSKPTAPAGSVVGGSESKAVVSGSNARGDAGVNANAGTNVGSGGHPRLDSGNGPPPPQTSAPAARRRPSLIDAWNGVVAQAFDALPVWLGGKKPSSSSGQASPPSEAALWAQAARLAPTVSQAAARDLAAARLEARGFTAAMSEGRARAKDAPDLSAPAAVPDAGADSKAAETEEHFTREHLQEREDKARKTFLAEHVKEYASEAEALEVFARARRAGLDEGQADEGVESRRAEMAKTGAVLTVTGGDREEMSALMRVMRDALPPAQTTADRVFFDHVPATPLPPQGIKFHIGDPGNLAGRTRLLSEFMRVFKSELSSQVSFKICTLMKGMTGTQAGKFITIYPTKPQHAKHAAEVLDAVCASAGAGQLTLPGEDIPFSSKHCLTWRYGSFTERKLFFRTTGEVADDRTDVKKNLARWVDGVAARDEDPAYWLGLAGMKVPEAGTPSDDDQSGWSTGDIGEMPSEGKPDASGGKTAVKPGTPPTK